jgi:trimeric autotransporter adhesin
MRRQSRVPHSHNIINAFTTEQTDMKNYVFLSLMLLISVAGVAAQSFEQQPLEKALNPDGTLRQGTSGSFTAQGYDMKTDANGRPIFLPKSNMGVMNTPNTWDSQFTLPNGTDGVVYVIATDGAGNYYVGGIFNTVANVLASSIARFNVASNTWSSLSSSTGNGVNGIVHAIAVLGTEVFVGGQFTEVNLGGTVVNARNVARFNTITNTWSALTGADGGNGVNEEVRSLAVSGNVVFVGGFFTQANTGGTAVSANRVARFNTTTNAWSALTGANGGNGVLGGVYALAVLGNDVFVGGNFNIASIGGTPVVNTRCVARFNISTNTWSALSSSTGNGVSGTVYAIAAAGNEVFVGGEFLDANVGGIQVPAIGIARFNISTNTWSALASDAGNVVSGGFFTLSVVGNNLFVGGNFRIADAGGTVVSANKVARFNTSTNTWSTLVLGTENYSEDLCFALTVVGNEVFFGGVFTQANTSGIPVVSNNIARFNTATNVSSALGSSGGNGLNKQVNAIAVLGNDVFVGGNFTVVGSTLINRVARFNTATNTWSALTGVGGGNGVDGTVNALVVVGNDVFVGGDFTQANVGGTTIATNNIARFNISTNTWSALTGANGGNGISGDVYSLAVVGSNVYVGGRLWQANAGGTTVAVNNIARFNTSTNAWSAVGSGIGNGVNGDVFALASIGNDIFLGGQFTAANSGGTTVTVSNIVRFNTANNTWSALGLSGMNGSIRTLAVLSDDIYLGGFFTQVNVGGTAVSANRVARFNTTTNMWSALSNVDGGNGVSGGVYKVAASGNTIVIGGGFTTANVGGVAVSANSIARFNLFTNIWSALGSGGSNGVNGLVFGLNFVGTDVFVGGSFTQVNSGAAVVSANIARYFSALTATASSTQSVSSNGVVNFTGTGVSVNFTGVSGSGTATVERYDAPASAVLFSGAPPVNTSPYRFVITASGFTFSNAELRFNRTQIPNAGIGNAQTVTVYRRPTPGTGAFTALPNTFDAGNPDEIRATTTGFSEFIFGSGADNPLPVELADFGFRKADVGIELVWKTATEKNNTGFTVERRTETGSSASLTDRKEWSALGFVKGNGTTTESKSYSFVDRTASGKVSYRLKQVDFDGAFEYSPIVEADAGVPRTFALSQNYPNPFNPTTIISYQLPINSEVRLVIYDMLGRELQTLVNTRQNAGRYSVQWSINNNQLSSGVYFYRLSAGGATNGAQNFVQTKKMLLVK